MTEHQAVLLEMLKEIDRICRKQDIPYQLFAGTLLGAVRHRGFIPWDDDLDIVMLRKDYERFLQFAERELDREKYALQREFSEHWPMFFSKLRRNRTTCLERFVPNDPQMHQGVYVDIFPCDPLLQSNRGKILQFAASKVVIAKSLGLRGYRTNNLLKKLFVLFCQHLSIDKLHEYSIQKQKNTSMVHCFFGGASKFSKSIFPVEWLKESINLPFEDDVFPVSKYYHQLLTRLYGDYTILPSQKEQDCKVHGVLVNLERSYEVYAEHQRNMKFRGHSRSIR